jgi:L-alanine-DL-glutamate epimerase-like enolase superfamily enzyme
MTPRAIEATIVSVETLAVSLPVRPELVVSGARGTHDHSDFLLTRVTTSAGVQGYGEVSATLMWSGEDAGTAEHVIRTALAPAIVGRPLTPVADLQIRMDKAVAASPFTKAGVSTALWDAFARTLDVPLAVALGGPLRISVPVKFSLSGEGERLLTTYKTAYDLGFRAFKLKVGLDPVVDAERFAQARQLVGPDTFLGTDGNGGYTRAEARRAIELMRPHHPEFLEQWVCASDLTGMRQLRDIGVPIIADESVFGVSDLVAAVRAEAADVVSLYVGKSGGPDRAVRMAHIADAFGLEVLLGSNGEQGLGAAAQLHVACASPGLSSAFPSDIIGANYYNEDVLAEPLPGDGQWVYLPDGPGLGVELREDLIGQFR